MVMDRGVGFRTTGRSRFCCAPFFFFLLLLLLLLGLFAAALSDVRMENWVLMPAGAVAGVCESKELAVGCDSDALRVGSRGRGQKVCQGCRPGPGDAAVSGSLSGSSNSRAAAASTSQPVATRADRKRASGLHQGGEKERSHHRARE